MGFNFLARVILFCFGMASTALSAGVYTPSGSMFGVPYIRMVEASAASFDGSVKSKSCKVAQLGYGTVSNPIIWVGGGRKMQGSGYCLVEIDVREFDSVFSGCLLQNVEFNPEERARLGEFARPKISVRMAQGKDRVFFEWYGFDTDFEYICFLK